MPTAGTAPTESCDAAARLQFLERDASTSRAVWNWALKYQRAAFCNASVTTAATFRASASIGRPVGVKIAHAT